MEKRTILVTGGNRGIGLATVEGLSTDKNNLVLIGCRDLEAGKKEASRLGENVKAVHLDLSDREGMLGDIEVIRSEFGEPDVLINNAAVLNEGSIFEIDDDQFMQALQVNVLSVYDLIRAFAPSMMEKGYGRIVNISSGWGSFNEGLTGPFSYSFTKASLNAITKTVAQSLSGDVKINSMCPGWVRTRMGGDAAPRTPAEGAQTAIFLANLPAGAPNGSFFRDKSEIPW
ncbi:MAG: SDR family NAD(P)-dependent oxidoreductase [Deltaproteobacteria bacterium]|nr:MAG: SDR family NAD(P)-dependent oxidoreductase [Deltaproteobacteria bacterium]TNF29267.1 MAG: SDR family NAD(P)-dependent oxidoreductase [Deltaproteobacteria bacterium]